MLKSRGKRSREAEEECWEDELRDVSVSQKVYRFQVVEYRRVQGWDQVLWRKACLLWGSICLGRGLTTFRHYWKS